MIVKVQRAITPPNGPLYLYDRARQHQRFIPQAEAGELLAKMGDRVRAFFHAELEAGQFKIGEPAPDEHW